MDPVGCGEPPAGSEVTAMATIGPADAGRDADPIASSTPPSKVPALIFSVAVISQS
jgi:hypothetical protein